jgi:hypothetical protein
MPTEAIGICEPTLTERPFGGGGGVGWRASRRAHSALSPVPAVAVTSGSGPDSVTPVRIQAGCALLSGSLTRHVPAAFAGDGLIPLFLRDRCVRIRQWRGWLWPAGCWPGPRSGQGFVELVEHPAHSRRWAPTWQWAPAPSTSVKLARVAGAVRCCISSSGWPRKNPSDSPRPTNTGQLIFSAISPRRVYPAAERARQQDPDPAPPQHQLKGHPQ